MKAQKSRVMVVDDDIRMLRMIKRTLEMEGLMVLTAGSGETALKSFEKEAPDLVLLDIMMPDIDGYEVCRHIRDFSQTPIIMVSAKDNDQEKVEGLDTGADDYITKPFSSSELMARVRAILRRTTGQSNTTVGQFRSSDLTIDFAARRVTVDGREIKLTQTEYKVLSYLARNAGRIVTPDQLLDKVWGEEYVGDPHLLQVNIARLRQKIGDDARNPSYIMTRPGIGYMIFKEP